MRKSTRRHKGDSDLLVVAIILLALVGVVVLAYGVIVLSTPYPEGRMLPLVISKDFVMTKRPWPPQQVGGFYMRENENLVIRDCKVYTSESYLPTELRRDRYWEGKVEGMVYLDDFANLTMINVEVIPEMFIQMGDNSSLKLVNVKNILRTAPGSYWPYLGQVWASENSRAWIEDSRIGDVQNVVAINSQLGSSSGSLVLEFDATPEKSAFGICEAIPVTMQLRNTGQKSLSFSSGDQIRIFARSSTGTETTISFNLTGDGQGLPDLVAGGVLNRTFTWTTPALPVGRYVIEGRFYSQQLGDWSRSRTHGSNYEVAVS